MTRSKALSLTDFTLLTLCSQINLGLRRSRASVTSSTVLYDLLVLFVFSLDPPNMATFEAYPRELSHLKDLLLRKQYRQCINVSSALLSSLERGDSIHPLSRLFATFYLAMANDELARLMHEHSLYKIATFDAAEKHYRQALKLIPSLEESRDILRRQRLEDTHDGFTKASPQSQENEPRSPSTPTLAHSQLAHDSTLEGDTLDLECRDSFDTSLPSEASIINLPRRILERDYSSMSLLSARPKLSKSTSQGLLRPIRLGSPPKAYHLPPKLPYFGKDHSNQASRSPSMQLNIPSTLAAEPTTATPIEPSFTELSRLEEQFDGIHTQVKTHIDLLHRAKLATMNAQAERAARVNNKKHSPQMSIPHSKSFWSFTPVNVKLAEKQKKIEEGRARGWQRKRYDPERCEALIDNALAEL